ncbi:LOW QUALITY PROTEIN: testis-expressed protein 264 [Aquarana catesbeiana]|uniref:LOW QUALITY PROTEIN: testis-expressed protein 264 n=1 Tax=Aquarana catesbeiana TaxID=8400 RepID=UPI003CCA608A
MSSVPEWVLISLIAALIGLLLLTLFGLAVYSGLLTEVEVRAGPPPIRGVVVAYKFRVGPYDESGNLYTESVSLAPKLVSVGVYYDNPMKVPVEFCRYIVGSILSEGDEKPLPDHVRIFRKHGFKFCVLPEVNHAVMATFPYTTPFSIQLATTRVHPALERYVKFWVLLDSELDPLLLDDQLSLELVSENQEKEKESVPQNEPTDSEKSEKSPASRGPAASSFEELDLDGQALGTKSQPDSQAVWSKMPDTWDKESPEE